MKHIIQDELWAEAVEGWADKKVTVYLSRNHEEYKELRERAGNLCEKFSFIELLIHGEGAVELTSEEHCIFTEYLDVKDRIEQLEREYHYYLGLAVTAPLRQAVQPFQGEMDLAEDDADERKGRILDLLAEDIKNREDEKRILALEEDLKKLELPEEVRRKIDSYVSAVNAQWLEYSEFMYRYGIKDILALLRSV